MQDWPRTRNVESPIPAKLGKFFLRTAAIEPTVPGASKAYHGLVRIDYQVRAASFATVFVAIGMQLWPSQPGGLMWALLALQFLVYPHLIFWRARLAPYGLKAEQTNLLLDSLLLGAWACALEFPVWIAFTLFLGTLLNNVMYRGVRGGLGALLAYSFGALAWGLVAGFKLTPYTDVWAAALCMLGLSAYVTGIGNIVYAQYRKLRDTRDALRQSEERYRIITENAGDLIAMLDTAGRWVYSNPAYRRLLPEAALALGADALAQLHPEDRAATRAVLDQAMQTGESQAFLYRLIAPDGKEHEFQAKAKSFAHAGVGGTVVVSTDVTELRQRDRKLALQANVFENMADAMMIIGADGTILSVNRAFTKLTGYGAEEAYGKSETEFRTALQPPEYYQEIYRALNHEGSWSGTSWCRRKDQSIYREWRNVSAIRDAGGNITHYIALFGDVAQSASSDHAVRASVRE